MDKTYLNRSGSPIIRKCSNCLNFKPIEGSDMSGYCKAMQMYFAFTHDKSVYAIVKDFYLCEKHEFENEQILSEQSEQVDLLSFLKERIARKNNY
jgi:hypothetical protein